MISPHLLHGVLATTLAGRSDSIGLNPQVQLPVRRLLSCFFPEHEAVAGGRRHPAAVRRNRDRVDLGTVPDDRLAGLRGHVPKARGLVLIPAGGQRFPSRVSDRARTAFSWPLNMSALPFATDRSTILTEWSPLPSVPPAKISLLLSGVKTTLEMLSGNFMPWMNLPFSVSQITTVLSLPTVAQRDPLGAKATPRTRSVCPFRETSPSWPRCRRARPTCRSCRRVRSCCPG